MTKYIITIDGLDYVDHRTDKPVRYYTDITRMGTELVRIKDKHPMWHVKFRSEELVEKEKKQSYAQQVLDEHINLHDTSVTWKQCVQPSCVKLQEMVRARAQTTSNN